MAVEGVWNKTLLKLRRLGRWLVLVVLLSLSMEKNKLIREKTRMTHKKKIASLAQESLLSLVLSLSLKPIIAVAVDSHAEFQYIIDDLRSVLKIFPSYVTLFTSILTSVYFTEYNLVVPLWHEGVAYYDISALMRCEMSHRKRASRTISKVPFHNKENAENKIE
ncbi:unnamed protein product [Sphenostylis stenocarpa]|uniref:Uncharacterized protein n=1 Tax=Sphenostylis stenocarpa TaxID=92480 RepID=A0AA86S521_9FABA|nr:unnamed protein product [Sphenostylis stenocarpa]